MIRFPLRLAAAACLFAIASFPLFAIDIHIAPFVFIDDSNAPDPSGPTTDGDLYSLLQARDFSGLVAFKWRMPSGEESLPAPRSLLEALRLADAEDFPYVLYGYVRKTDDSYVAELKLVDRDARNIAAVFFGGDTVDKYDRLLQDLDGKIDSYLRTTFNLDPEKGEGPVRRYVWSIPFEAGYWMPLSSAWSGEVTGLAYGKLGVRFWPRMPAFVKRSHPRQIGGGLDAEYAMGMNVPGREEAVLHSAIGRLAFDYVVDFDGRHRIGVSAGPFLRMDFLTQSRMYDEEVRERTSVPGFGGEFQYSYLVGERLELGAVFAIDAAFYSEVLVTASPRLRISYRFISKDKERRRDR